MRWEEPGENQPLCPPGSGALTPAPGGEDPWDFGRAEHNQGNKAPQIVLILLTWQRWRSLDPARGTVR